MKQPSLKGEISRVGDDRKIGKETRRSTQDLETDIYVTLLLLSRYGV
jgi:hypothetical protein